MRSAARAAMLALALGASACGGGSAEPAAGAPAQRRASRQVGDERREAVSPGDPRTAVRFDVPPGARRAVVHVAAWRTDWRTKLRWGGSSESCVASVVGPSGPAHSTTITARLANSEHGARWSEASVELDGATALELSCPSLPAATETWFATPVWDGVAPPSARNVLLVSLDTVRIDAVSAHGQALPTTPALDELARRGTLWTQAIAPAPWTLPSHVSAMTGLFPSWHGRWQPGKADHGEPDVPTLAETLSRAGWETAAFTGEGWISWTFGATRDFGLVVEQENPHRWQGHESALSASRAEAWLRARAARPGAAPFFLFWHTYEPHWPYRDGRFVGKGAALPPGVAEDAREDWERYLGDVAAADEGLAQILNALDDLGLRASTDVLVFSDHGEELGEHSDGRRDETTQHGHGLWDTLLRVPLVASSPMIAPGRRDEQVSLVDVFPTVLACAGVAAPPNQGIPLIARGGRVAAPAESLYPEYVEREQKCWRERALKHAGGLYDLTTDPLELNDVTSSRPDDARRMRDAAAAFWSTAPAATAVRGTAGASEPLTPEQLESLRSLGYVR